MNSDDASKARQVAEYRQAKVRERSLRSTARFSLHYLDAVIPPGRLGRDETIPNVPQDELLVSLLWITIAAPSRSVDDESVPFLNVHSALRGECECFSPLLHDSVLAEASRIPTA